MHFYACYADEADAKLQRGYNALRERSKENITVRHLAVKPLRLLLRFLSVCKCSV
jgi:hypothetical protein